MIIITGIAAFIIGGCFGFLAFALASISKDSCPKKEKKDEG